MIKKIKRYKEKNFGSWLEFIMTFGVCRFEDGGFLLTVYGWGPLSMIIIALILKMLKIL
jgi:hypothetical protein